MSIFTIIQPLASKDLYLIPNADGCHIDLTPIGDTNNWECVDDPIATPDEDTTHVHSKATNLKYDLYGLPNHTTEIGTINYVQVFTRAKSQTFSQHEDGIYKILITDNACTNIYKSADMDLTASTYKTYSNTWSTNPRRDAPWTWDDIDNLQIGLECSSPTISNVPTTLTIRPNAIGDTTEFVPSPAVPNWQNVDEETRDDSTTYNRSIIYGGTTDLYNLTDHTSESETITGITVFAWVYIDYKEGTDKHISTKIKTNGFSYVGTSHFSPVKKWILISTNYSLNPKTDIAWTWNDIDNLQAGVYAAPPLSALYNHKCTQVYVVIHYHTTGNPEIRTTQCYVKINYVPPDVECTLNKPEKISVNHNMNIKMLNFWNGTREVYSLNRSGKSMILTGSEYQSDTCNKACPCEHITCMRDMGKDGSTITISGLRNLFNGNFKIRSFGWKHISEKPECYDWILELEYDD